MSSMIDSSIELRGLDPEFSALLHRLDVTGYDHLIKETYGGNGFTLLARRRQSVPRRVATEPMLRDACQSALREEPKHAHASGDFRVRLRSIAARVNESPRAVAGMLRGLGLTVIAVAGTTWVVRDAKWQRFVGTPPILTPVRTPVRTPVA